MITKRLSSNVDSITSDRIDTVSKRRNISADEATNTDTYFSYALPTGSLLVHEDIIDYEMELLVQHNDGIREGIAIGRKEGLAAGRKERLSQGLKQGQAAGSQLRAQKMAISMLEDKASIALISKYTGLSEQEIRSLAKEHDLL
jgi:flagellar biosynthesis/type III secretory pathway protein FliH